MYVRVAESVLGVPGRQRLLVMMLREPLAAIPVAKVSSQVSTSDPERVTVTGESSPVVTVCALAVGRSLAQVMEMTTVAGLEVKTPSSTV